MILLELRLEGVECTPPRKRKRDALESFSGEKESEYVKMTRVTMPLVGDDKEEPILVHKSQLIPKNDGSAACTLEGGKMLVVSPGEQTLYKGKEMLVTMVDGDTFALEDDTGVIQLDVPTTECDTVA